MSKPSPTSHPNYFQKYIDLVQEDDLFIAFKNQTASLQSFLSTINEEKSNTAYATGKWTIKELLQHVIDTERIFAFRSLCFARGEQQNIPGFEEDDYAALSHANSRTWQSLIDEFLAVRKTTALLFESFTTADLERVGTANNNKASVSSLGFITLGHYYHHKNILQERYL